MSQLAILPIRAARITAGYKNKAYTRAWASITSALT